MNDMFETSSFEFDALPFAGEFRDGADMQETDFGQPELEWESEYRRRWSPSRSGGMFHAPRMIFPRPSKPAPRLPRALPPKFRWPRRVAMRPYGVRLAPDFIDASLPSTAPGTAAEYVRWAQNALNDVLGLQLPVHGVMDAATRSAVRSFQQREGLPVDGVVGPDTERALIDARRSMRRVNASRAEPGASQGPEPGTTHAGRTASAADGSEGELSRPAPPCSCPSCRRSEPCPCQSQGEYIQPELFEFEPESSFDEFETDVGEFESDFGEDQLPLGELDLGSLQPCDKTEPATLRVPFRIDFDEFLKLVCCAIGRWMPFRTDRPPGWRARCFVKKHEPLLWDIHTEMFVKRIPCVELQAQYCRRKGVTTDVTLMLKQFLSTACPPSSLCKTGVCSPSVACAPITKSPENAPRSPRCKRVDKLTRSICDNAKKICKLADDLNDPSSRDKCEKARASCEAALRRSKSCDTIMDCRSGVCVPRPR